ncbi:hypothetical protein [Flavobacterium sp.]|uniref:hypothetical protein n=1 Tax=Flavobacterium sp. TaxID=239 RepID=UPI0024886FE0|nr:hypothetical protein [Flavobacterium sp.]MDI1315758.1 hypothetical protein [Flavobacterium sp.]
MKYSSFLKRNKQEVQKGIILVTGKHMNRTALGIVDALLTLYPQVSFEELKEMLPDTINPSAPKNYKSLFAPYNPNRKYGVVQPGTIKEECIQNGLDCNASHFTAENETFKTKDGIEVLVSKSWESNDTLTGENDLQNLINHVKQYGIVVNSFEPKTEPFKKGSYQIHILNNELFNKITAQKSKNNSWLIVGAVFIILVLGVVIFKFLNS